MSEQQKQAIAVLREKIAKNPNNPKVQKWKQIIANTERDMSNKQGTTKMVTNRSQLTAAARRTHDSAIDNVQSQIRKEYLHTLVYPDQYAYRMPDELTQPTVLYKSVREFNLLANLDGTPNSGRFSFAVKPILGGTSSVHNFQVGIVDNTTAWPTSITDFRLPATYVNNNLYSDPRVDPMILPLTSGPLNYYHYNLYNEPVPSLGPSTYYNMLAPKSLTNNYGSLMIDFTTIPSAGSLSFVVPGYGQQTLLANSAGVVLFSVPTGTYIYSPEFTAVGTWANTNSISRVALVAFTSTYEYRGIYQISQNDPDVIDGVFIGKVRELYDHDGQIHNVNQGQLFDVRAVVQLNENFKYALMFYINGNAVNNATMGMTLTSTAEDTLPLVSNSGSVIKLRPISCTALVTCTLPDINAGGNIVAYSAPSGDIDNYYYNVSAQLGPFQEWENLARTNKGKLIHDGNFKTGSFTWTQPWDKNDVLMRTPTEANDYEYQGVIVSGQINPSVALTGVVNCGRIRIVIMYEYLTDNRLFTPESCIGSTADLDWVLGYCGTQVHSTENADHMAKLKGLLKTGANLVSKSVPYVIKGAETAGKIASLASLVA